MGKYKVEFKAFKTGEWYTKTSSDNIGSACSVAECNSYGRAYRVTNTENGQIVKSKKEDESMKACNGYPNGKPWWQHYDSQTKNFGFKTFGKAKEKRQLC